jgi:hypothetical protein
VEFLDAALQGDRLAGIEHGKGMMPDSRDRKRSNRDTRKDEYVEFHWRLQVFLRPYFGLLANEHLTALLEWQDFEGYRKPGGSAHAHRRSFFRVMACQAR